MAEIRKKKKVKWVVHQLRGLSFGTQLSHNSRGICTAI
jgi:hypothetical protein